MCGGKEMNEFEKVQYKAYREQLAKAQMKSMQETKEFKSMLTKLKNSKRDVTDTIFRTSLTVDPDGTEFLIIREVTTGRNGKLVESKVISKQKVAEPVMIKEEKEEIVVEKLKKLPSNGTNESLVNIMAKQGFSCYKVAKRRRKITTLSLEHF